MKNTKYRLRGHARSDIAQIRRYTIKKWGKGQWEIYKTALMKKLQHLADNPEIGMVIDEISLDSFRFPLKDHVIYYLKKDEEVIFVGIIPSSMSPDKHLSRKQMISKERI